MNEVHRATKTYVNEWGCSVIPLEAKAKRPPEGFSVMPYKSRRPDSGELHDWYAEHADRGVAILCGGVSGGLLALDVDHPEYFTPWEEAHPELAGTRRQKTRRGYHLLFYLRNRATAPAQSVLDT